MTPEPNLEEHLTLSALIFILPGSFPVLCYEDKY